MKRIVVVGCGSIGRRHARQLAQRNDVALELCDVSAENIAISTGEVGQLPTHESFEKMLTTRPDMLVVATPPAFHASQAVAALEAGIHVLCEKPMCDSLEDARRMRKAAEASDRILDVGFVMHFHPAMRAMKEAIQENRFGNILHIHWHIGTYETLLRSASRHQAESFGALAYDYAHQPDLLAWWLGKNPTQVHAAGIQQGNLSLSSNPNVMTIAMEYDNSRIATLNLNYVQQPSRAHCEIIGDEGWAYVDVISGSITFGNIDGTTEVREFVTDADSMIRDEQQWFIDAVNGRHPAQSPVSSSIQSMFVIDAAIRSLKSGKVESVECV
jgi:predicted dehydrogenase